MEIDWCVKAKGKIKGKWVVDVIRVIVAIVAALVLSGRIIIELRLW